jgi:hypothetical protein
MAPNRSRLTMLAGWLFADLFLVLLVIGLAVMPARPGVKPPPPPPAHHHKLGLNPRRIDFAIALSPDSFRAGAHNLLVQEVNSELERRNPAHLLVGFVLVFASDSQANVLRADETATQAFKLLRRRSPAFASAQGLGYWNGANNDFEFKVFLLNK